LSAPTSALTLMQADHPHRFTHRTTTFHGQAAWQFTAPDGSQALVLMQGGQLVSWKTAGGVERLFLSDQAVYASGAAVRGGVPVVFPQFSQRGPLLKHGFARTQAWALQSVDTTETDALLVLQLHSNELTRSIWPFEFELELSFRWSALRLDMELAAFNTGDQPWSFTAALHTYLRVNDFAALRLEGLHRLRFFNAVTQTEQIERGEVLCVNGELDRIYFDAARPLVVHLAEHAQVSQEGFKDVVIWNPGPEQSATLKDMPANGWQQMLCVEAAQVGMPVLLMPGESWCGRQSIDFGQ
jgi:glucose-6-phosphate 1-epimerase